MILARTFPRREARQTVAGYALVPLSLTDASRLHSAAMHRLETRLDGPMLLGPVVHGDERGLFLAHEVRELTVS